MTGPNSSAPRGGTPLWVRVVLLLSLAANLLVIGAVIGVVLNGAVGLMMVARAVHFPAVAYLNIYFTPLLALAPICLLPSSIWAHFRPGPSAAAHIFRKGEEAGQNILHLPHHGFAAYRSVWPGAASQRDMIDRAAFGFIDLRA